MGKTAEELRSEIVQQRQDLSRDFEMIGDRVSPARIVERRTEAAKGRMRRMKDAVMGSADDMATSASDRTGAMRDSAGNAVGEVGGMVADAPHRLEDGTRGNPLAAGMVAFGLGMLAATVLPSSNKERQLTREVQPQLEHAAQAAMAAGKDMAHEMQPAVQQAGADLGEAAKDAASEVQQKAQEHAGSATETVRASGQDLADRARG
jgi:gas vesicle protein